MTVQNLIDELELVEDKSKQVVYLDTEHFDNSLPLKIHFVEEEDARVELTSI